MVTSGTLLKIFQHLVNATFIRKYTRDRKGESVPDALQVLRVVDISNPINYLSYMRRRDEIFHRLRYANYKRYNTFSNFGVKTFQAQPNWVGVPGVGAEEPI